MSGADEIPVNARLAERVQALDESEASFLGMAEAAPTGIVIADAEGLASYANPRLSEITQTAAAGLLGRGWQHCLSDDQRQALQAGSGCLPPSLLGQRHCERLPLRGGQVRWLAILIRPVRNSELAVTGYVAMIDDVTAVEEANERRRGAERERQDGERRQVAARLDSLTRTVCVLYMSGYAAPIMTEQGLLDPASVSSISPSRRTNR